MLLIDQLELQRRQFDAAARERYLGTIYGSREGCAGGDSETYCVPTADLRLRELAVRELTGMVNQHRHPGSSPPMHYLTLTRPDLSGMNLEEVWFDGWRLRSALLVDANLYNAHLPDADLQYADLTGARLAGADLNGSSLENAKLYRVIDLEYSLGLRQSQLDSACGDAMTTIPSGLDRPGHWAKEAWEKGLGDIGCPTAW